MQLSLALCLPREEATAGLARRAVASSLTQLGVTNECAHDIELAISEACTNVIRHAEPGKDYEVRLEVDGDLAIIRVMDTGVRFAPAEQQPSSDVLAESGRGIAIMRFLVDRLHFEVKAEAGTILHLEKKLTFVPGSPLRH
jgi:serine/threonine-protein kinase RsbW